MMAIKVRSTLIEIYYLGNLSQVAYCFRLSFLADGIRVIPCIFRDFVGNKQDNIDNESWTSVLDIWYVKKFCLSLLLLLFLCFFGVQVFSYL